MPYLYDLLDESGQPIERRAYPEPVAVGPGAPGEFARMVFVGEFEPPPPRVLTPRQFRERLTAAEQAAITAASMTDPQVFDWRLRAAEAQEIELDHPETIAGVDFLVAKGLITAARRDEILAA